LIGGRKFNNNACFQARDRGDLANDCTCRNVTHYSYFGAFRSDVSNVGTNAAMLTEKGQLTDIGSWYMGGKATNNIPKGSDAAASYLVSGSLFVVVAALWVFAF
jgi:hypothetical protein